MKNYYINLVLIVILITSFSYIRAESLISFSGYVRTVNDTLPIVEKEIFINLNEEIQIVTNTDQNGYYFYLFDLDSINAISAVVGVLDCTGSLFVEEFNPLESSNIADFYICNGEINCQAFFDYFTDAENYKQIYFINLSLGNYNSLLWDFGDGTFSNEDTPTKVFNEDGIYPVSLYIYDTVGECESSFTQTIFVFENDTTNCIAEFSY
ncbi:MAG: hypothetical protein C0598_00925, partial [Marinilabiliales bacterium]